MFRQADASRSPPQYCESINRSPKVGRRCGRLASHQPQSASASATPEYRLRRRDGRVLKSAIDFIGNEPSISSSEVDLVNRGTHDLGSSPTSTQKALKVREGELSLTIMDSHLISGPPPNMASTTEPENLWSRYSSILAGGWRCVSYHMYTSDDPSSRGLVAKPHGDDPLGRVLISPNGYLSAHIARRGRLGPLASGKQWIIGGDAEVAHVARGLSMYCGYMQLFEDEKGLYWHTKVEVSSDPARTGRVEERRVRLFEDAEGKPVLELTPRQDMLTDVSVL